jgi:outer membrane biogenesis lipoprotein LolB
MKHLISVFATLLLVGCADNKAAEMKAETANQNVQKIKAIINDMGADGIFIQEDSGQAKFVNYEQLAPQELEKFKSQLITLIELGQEVLAIDARRDVRVKDVDQVEQIVQLAEEALMRVSDLKSGNAYLG